MERWLALSGIVMLTARESWSDFQVAFPVAAEVAWRVNLFEEGGGLVALGGCVLRFVSREDRAGRQSQCAFRDATEHGVGEARVTMCAHDDQA